MKIYNKIDAINRAIERAINHQSKMDDVAWNVPALSSLKIRHLMNNLGAISTRYFECGVHRGGIFFSTVCNNNLLSATANDSFASDENSEEKIEQVFAGYFSQLYRRGLEFKMLKDDTFSFDHSSVLGPIDLYLFDADHSYESQRKAVTHFLPAMADEFIMCVDDFDWAEVSEGTRDGLADAGVEILFERVFEGNNHDNDGWWNGFAVFLLKKK